MYRDMNDDDEDGIQVDKTGRIVYNFLYRF